MKLFNRVIIRLSVCMVVVLTLWAVLFYCAMIEEITDEVDDSLEDYAEMIMIRSLAGDTLPSNDSGSNNQYFIKEISEAEAMLRPAIVYRDEMVYVKAKKETEPARILTTIFQDRYGKYFLLEVSVPTIEKMDLIKSVVYLIITLYAGLLLAFLLVNVFVFRRSMKPFYELLEWLGSSRLGSGGNVPQIKTDTEEFSRLNEAVARYARHSEEIFQQQKQFIGNASHEVQTPIAVCINRIEMLMEDENLTQKQMEELM
ncbi:MAG: HAMP domain-containing histidine kinase, partial [Bacteroidales bacterium]|nr:HAMP domain-containing histidine kinase [Bacteroidales bacterium]